MSAHKTSVSSQRALEIWPHLIAQATEQNKITYGELSERIFGHRASQSLTRPLSTLCAYCERMGLPLLPILAVSKRTGKPGAGPDVYPDIVGETKHVFQFDWSKVPIPDLQDFA